MPDEQERPPPRQFDWAVMVYDKMMEQATPQDLVDEDSGLTSSNVGVMVYEGHLTHLFAELSIANPYYTSVMKALKDTGCVEQLRRGGGSAKSQWVLHSRPTAEQFKDRVERNRPNNTKYGQLEQQVRDLRSLCSQLQDRDETVQNVLDTFTERLTKLEGKVHDMEQLGKVDA